MLLFVASVVWAVWKLDAAVTRLPFISISGSRFANRQSKQRRIPFQGSDLTAWDLRFLRQGIENTTENPRAHVLLMRRKLATDVATLYLVTILASASAFAIFGSHPPNEGYCAKLRRRYSRSLFSKGTVLRTY